ncbi:MAG: EAL domain-containing protein [Burkholderiales bacterium]
MLVGVPSKQDRHRYGIRHDARAVVASVISMAHNLDLQVVAEGVETQYEATTLKALGCDQGQGHLFGKPLPASEYESSFH